MRVSSNNLKLKVEISDFDLAFCLKKDTFEVNQGFNIPDRRFAPEIEARAGHAHPVDVWGLGNIADHLLTHHLNSSSFDRHRKPSAESLVTDLHNLASFMT